VIDTTQTSGRARSSTPSNADSQIFNLRLSGQW
jgi:hypothetical protein